MATNTAALAERFNEIAAVSALAQLSRRLNELATEPSTKRWTRNRPSAAAAWGELRELAAGRAAAAAKAPAPKRAAKPAKPTVSEPPTANAAA